MMTNEQNDMIKRSIIGVDELALSEHELETLYFLNRSGLISTPSSLDKTVHYISEAGKAYLQSQEEIAKQKAKDEAKQRSDRNFKILAAVTPFITFIAGALVDHFSGVVEWIVSLFH